MNRMVLSLVWVLVCISISRAKDTQAPSTTTPYMVIVTGEELLTGVYADGHTQFLTRTLHPLGLTCVGSISVDDKSPDMHAALTFAARRAELILVTGGLGPTAGDITREVLAEFSGIPLAENGQVVAELARRFGTSPEKLRANVRRQARVPTSGTTLKNAKGSAVGLVFEKDQQTLVALPGPPHELQPMVRNALVPYLTRRYGTRTPGASLTLRFVGLGQSRIAQVLADHIPLDSQTHVTSQFQEGRVDFTFTRNGHTPADQAALTEIEQGLRRYVGESIYAQGETSLEEEIIQRLRMRNQFLTVAEVGSGGSVAAALTRVPGAQAVLVGSYGAPSLDRLQVLLGGPLSVPAGPEKPLIAVLAERVVRSDREWGLVVGEIKPRTDTPGSLQVAILKPQAFVTVHTLPWQDASGSARTRLVTRLLDLLRREFD